MSRFWKSHRFHENLVCSIIDMEHIWVMFPVLRYVHLTLKKLCFNLISCLNLQKGKRRVAWSRGCWKHPGHGRKFPNWTTILSWEIPQILGKMSIHNWIQSFCSYASFQIAPAKWGHASVDPWLPFHLRMPRGFLPELVQGPRKSRVRGKIVRETETIRVPRPSGQRERLETIGLPKRSRTRDRRWLLRTHVQREGMWDKKYTESQIS